MSDNQPSTADSIARTPDGSIANQGQTTETAATTPQTTTTPDSPTEEPSLASQDGKSLANRPATEEGKGAPETYGEFKVPEGYTLDEDVTKEATGIFKEMNLSQSQAQKLVDFYVGKTNEAVNAPYEAWRQTQQEWVKQVKNDPVIGPRLSEVTNTISRAIDGLGDAKLAQEFRQAMDYTGAGNNPAFIRAFYKLAQKVTEGGHVQGRGPSELGQRRQGEVPSAAAAMYPNLAR
jgi:antitoxin component of RelBE/YafQ-DinJ toxin-antitoxin module